MLKVKFFTLSQTRESFPEMSTTAAGHQHLKKALCLTERSTLSKQKLAGINKILPVASQPNSWVSARPGVWSRVRGRVCSVGSGWEGLRFANGGQTAWPTGQCNWWCVVRGDLCPLQLLPYLVIVAKLHKQCPQAEISHLSRSCFIRHYFIKLKHEFV